MEHQEDSTVKIRPLNHYQEIYDEDGLTRENILVLSIQTKCPYKMV